MQNLESFESSLFNLIGEYSENKFYLSEKCNICKVKYKCHRCDRFLNSDLSTIFKLLPSNYSDYIEYVTRIHSLTTVLSARHGLDLKYINLCNICTMFAISKSGYLATGYLGRKKSRRYKEKLKNKEPLNSQIVDKLFNKCIKYGLWPLNNNDIDSNQKRKILKFINKRIDLNTINMKDIIKYKNESLYNLATLFQISEEIENTFSDIRHYF